jgi:hypothetical protein
MRLLHEEVSVQVLAQLDAKRLFRPSFYEDLDADSGLISVAVRDARSSKKRGDPHRRYTFEDLLWLRIFVSIQRELKERRVSGAAKRAAKAVDAIKHHLGGTLPEDARLVVVGAEVYFVSPRGEAFCATSTGQGALREVVMHTLITDTRARVAVLQTMRSLAKVGQRQSDPPGDAVAV